MDANMSIWNRVKVKKEIRRNKYGNEIKDGTAAGEGVDENEKNRIIEKAVSKWTEMNMNGTQIAFGIAAMNVESGFNYRAKTHVKNPKTGKEYTASGLGQFNEATWEDAVNSYNSKNHAHLNPKAFDWNEDVQIEVMGGWIKEVTERMRKVQNDPMLKGKDELLILYSIWHSGCSASVDTLADFLNPNSTTRNKLTDEGRKFLIDTRDAVEVDVHKRVEEHMAAKQSALLRYQINEHNKRIAPYAADEQPDNVGKQSEAKSGFLVRYGNIVRRFNRDGSDDGSFVS